MLVYTTDKVIRNTNVKCASWLITHNVNKIFHHICIRFPNFSVKQAYCTPPLLLLSCPSFCHPRAPPFVTPVPLRFVTPVLDTGVQIL